jgi:hypothetical protein
MTAHVGPPHKMPSSIELKPRDIEKTHRHSQLQLVIGPKSGVDSKQTTRYVLQQILVTLTGAIVVVERRGREKEYLWIVERKVKYV